MPKGRHGKGGRGKQVAGKRKEKHGRRAEKREGYIRHGDPEFKSFSEQLAQQGLRLEDVPGDGNCLFRALAAQLSERSHTHQSLRQDVVHYMRQNCEEFEQFIAVDEEVDYKDYCDQLAQDGEYAGNDAIVAFSRSFSANVVIHQLNYPRWEILAPPKTTPTLVTTPPSPTKTVNIAYLNGEHYCSVLPLSSDAAPSAPLSSLLHTQSTAKSGSLETHGEVALGGGSAAAAADKKRVESKEKGGGNKKEEEEEVVGGGGIELQTLLSATGCEDSDLANQVLLESGCNVDLAIVELLQLMQLEQDTSVKPAEEKKEYVKPKKKLHEQPAKQGHLSNRERKALAKAERKERKREERGSRKDTATTTEKAAPLGYLTI